MGQKVVETFGIWKNSPILGHICMGQETFGQNVVGTIYLIIVRFWDNLPTEQKSLGQFTWGHCVLHQNWQNCLAGQKWDGNLRCWN